MRLSEFIQDMLYEIAEGVQGGSLRARNLVAIPIYWAANYRDNPAAEAEAAEFAAQQALTPQPR